MTRFAPPRPHEAVDPAALEDALARADHAVVRLLLEFVAPENAAEAIRIEIVRAQLARAEGNLPGWLAAATRAAEHAAAAPAAPRALDARMLHAVAARRSGLANEFETIGADVLARPAAEASYASYLLAIEAFFHRDFDRALAIAGRIAAAGALVAETRALAGWIAAERERFGDAAAHFESALDACDDGRGTDQRLHARATMMVAQLAAQRLDLPLGTRAQNAYHRVRWTTDLAVEHVRTLVALRDLALLEGDVEEAWLAARRAASLLDAGPWAVFGEANAAYVAAITHDRHAIVMQLRRAWRINDEIDWAAARFEDRDALTHFAASGAPWMPAEAARALEIYRSLRTLPARIGDFAEDRRARADELTAIARVAEFTDGPAAAIPRFELALAAYQDLGYQLYASRVASQLLRLTGDARYRSIVDGVLARAPNALIRTALPAADSSIGRLSPSERRVFNELLHGRSAKEIAATLGRSPHTISNQTRRIYAVFDVRSRSRLVARCVELGLVGPAARDE